jgi:hypothetical protein
MNIDEFRIYLDNIYTKTMKRVSYKSDSMKEIIIDCVKTGGKKEEDYIQVFKRIIARMIEYAEGFPDHNNKDPENKRERNIIVDEKRNLNMAVFFRIINKRFGRKLCEIYKIEIVNRDTYDRIFSGKV